MGRTGYCASHFALAQALIRRGSREDCASSCRRGHVQSRVQRPCPETMSRDQRRRVEPLQVIAACVMACRSLRNLRERRRSS